MNGCAGTELACELLGWLNSILDIKIAVVLTIVAYVAWQSGYSQGRSEANCKANDFCEGFINGIMFLMVKFKAKTNPSFDLVTERDIYVSEAICRISKGKEYKLPSGDKVC